MNQDRGRAARVTHGGRPPIVSGGTGQWAAPLTIGGLPGGRTRAGARFGPDSRGRVTVG
jgi:hypothetical protein